MDLFDIGYFLFMEEQEQKQIQSEEEKENVSPWEQKPRITDKED